MLQMLQMLKTKNYVDRRNSCDDEQLHLSPMQWQQMIHQCCKILLSRPFNPSTSKPVAWKEAEPQFYWYILSDKSQLLKNCSPVILVVKIN